MQIQVGLCSVCTHLSTDDERFGAGTRRASCYALCPKGEASGFPLASCGARLCGFCGSLDARIQYTYKLAMSSTSTVVTHPDGTTSTAGGKFTANGRKVIFLQARPLLFH
jgi:hypothetical protein